MITLLQDQVEETKSFARMGNIEANRDKILTNLVKVQGNLDSFNNILNAILRDLDDLTYDVEVGNIDFNEVGLSLRELVSFMDSSINGGY